MRFALVFPPKKWICFWHDVYIKEALQKVLTLTIFLAQFAVKLLTPTLQQNNIGIILSEALRYFAANEFGIAAI